jgi:serine/threonine-protein kinase RsbW
MQSRLSNLSEIDLFLDNIMQQFNVKEDFLGILSIPLNECVENAIVHGNKCDENKKVNIDVQYEKSKLLFSVTDEGIGFDYNSLLQKGIEQRTGNGLLLLEMLTEDLSFSKDGSQVSYKIDVPHSLYNNNERLGVFQHSQEAVKSVQLMN